MKKNLILILLSMLLIVTACKKNDDALVPTEDQIAIEESQKLVNQEITTLNAILMPEDSIEIIFGELEITEIISPRPKSTSPKINEISGTKFSTKFPDAKLALISPSNYPKFKNHGLTSESEGGLFTIKGTNFGTASGTLEIIAPGYSITNIKWSNTLITFRIKSSLTQTCKPMPSSFNANVKAKIRIKTSSNVYSNYSEFAVMPTYSYLRYSPECTYISDVLTKEGGNNPKQGPFYGSTSQSNSPISAGVKSIDGSYTPTAKDLVMTMQNGKTVNGITPRIGRHVGRIKQANITIDLATTKSYSVTIQDGNINTQQYVSEITYTWTKTLNNGVWTWNNSSEVRGFKIERFYRL